MNIFIHMSYYLRKQRDSNPRSHNGPVAFKAISSSSRATSFILNVCVGDRTLYFPVVLPGSRLASPCDGLYGNRTHLTAFPHTHVFKKLRVGFEPTAIPLYERGAVVRCATEAHIRMILGRGIEPLCYS